jgi:hypothetical protein
VTEGNAGTVNLVFTISLSAPTAAVVSVDWSTADGSALDVSDYVGAAGTATFAPGVTSQTVSVAVNGDVTAEPDETLFLNLGFAVNGTIADGQAVGRILNDDQGGGGTTPTISIGDASVVEGNAGGNANATIVTFAVTLSAPNPGPGNITVQYATAAAAIGSPATGGINCAADVDYRSVSPTTLTFLPGATTPTTAATVAVCGDTLVEAAEGFLVNLANPAGAAIADGQAIGTIIDDDTAGALVPVAAYGFEELTGATAIDTAGGDNNGTLGPEATRVPARTTAGRFGGALVFDGSNDWVTVPDAANLDLTTGMTLSAWVNPTTVGAAFRAVIVKEREGANLSYSLFANNGGGLPPSGYVSGGAGYVSAVGTTSLPAGTWTHLAVTYNGSLLSLYVNGGLVSTTPFTGSLAASGLPLRIGGFSADPTSAAFAGTIDEVRIYNQAQSPAAIHGPSRSCRWRHRRCRRCRSAMPARPRGTPAPPTWRSPSPCRPRRRPRSPSTTQPHRGRRTLPRPAPTTRRRPAC